MSQKSCSTNIAGARRSFGQRPACGDCQVMIIGLISGGKRARMRSGGGYLEAAKPSAHAGGRPWAPSHCRSPSKPCSPILLQRPPARCPAAPRDTATPLSERLVHPPATDAPPLPLPPLQCQVQGWSSVCVSAASAGLSTVSHSASVDREPEASEARHCAAKQLRPDSC